MLSRVQMRHEWTISVRHTRAFFKVCTDCNCNVNHSTNYSASCDQCKTLKNALVCRTEMVHSWRWKIFPSVVRHTFGGHSRAPQSSLCHIHCQNFSITVTYSTYNIVYFNTMHWLSRLFGRTHTHWTQPMCEYVRRRSVKIENIIKYKTLLFASIGATVKCAYNTIRSTCRATARPIRNNSPFALSCLFFVRSCVLLMTNFALIVSSTTSFSYYTAHTGPHALLSTFTSTASTHTATDSFW